MVVSLASRLRTRWIPPRLQRSTQSSADAAGSTMTTPSPDENERHGTGAGPAVLSALFLREDGRGVQDVSLIRRVPVCRQRAVEMQGEAASPERESAGIPHGRYCACVNRYLM